MQVSAVILAGGLGTRLRSVVPDVPKPLADINGVPFIFYLLEELSKTNITDVYISIGYKKECFHDTVPEVYKSLKIKFIEELEPLGTGGALGLCASIIDSDYMLVLNGDTFINQSLKTIIKPSTKCVIRTVHIDENTRYNPIEFVDNKLIVLPKSAKTNNVYINGGTYFIPKYLYKSITTSKTSFEDTYLSVWDLEEEKTNEFFIDIGIPEDYDRAQKEFQNFFRP